MADPRYETPPRPSDVNYDEAKVPPFELPPLLVCDDGRKVSSRQDWLERRRPELLAHFTREVFGRAPGESRVRVEIVRRDVRGASDFATCLELDAILEPPNASRSLTLRLLVWLPNQIPGKVPIFLGLNLFGNHTTHPDPTIRLASGWVPNSSAIGVNDYTANDASRGLHARRWPVELALARGYGIATLYAGDIDPDFDDGFQNGVHGLFGEGSGVRSPHDWGTLAAWAWGLSRALDALASVERVDTTKVGVVGHSRFGKAALWAAAQDTRFAWAIANNSGRGGAALSRRRFGEVVRDLNQRFPHWFASRFREYDEREHLLPIDQHGLLALIAPRPVYVATASLDHWGDPRGQFLACLAASPAFELFGSSGIRATEDDAASGRSIGDRIGYHCRPGGHDILASDWWHFIDFVERHRASLDA